MSGGQAVNGPGADVGATGSGPTGAGAARTGGVRAGGGESGGGAGSSAPATGVQRRQGRSAPQLGLRPSAIVRMMPPSSRTWSASSTSKSAERAAST